MEGFNEQVVKRKNGTKQLVIKSIAVLILISVPFIAAALAIATILGRRQRPRYLKGYRASQKEKDVPRAD